MSTLEFDKGKKRVNTLATLVGAIALPAFMFTIEYNVIYSSPNPYKTAKSEIKSYHDSSLIFQTATLPLYAAALYVKHKEESK